MTKHASPRILDHLVLPVANIDVARKRYGQLGFTIGADAKHPFGTENCCIFFEDGTFLEPLGIAHRETCESAALKGNSFVASDQAYRFRRGEEGFSNLVIKSNDAVADAKFYRKRAISGGRLLRFTRKFTPPSGKSDKASFAIAYAEESRSPDAGFFACEVVYAPKVDRSALYAHDNGTTRLLEVVMSEPNPSDFQYFLQEFLQQREMDNNSFGIEFALPGSSVSVLSPDGMKAFYGLDTPKEERGLRHSLFVLGVPDLNKVKNILSKTDVVFTEIGPNLIVPPAAGQGAALAFRETK
ncbi:MAG: lactoylglutathione lyase [Hyphomicrobiales bacterium]|nr:MAG: lactoylglutathione lyase [Hyphomicrobiales bacterium]